MARADGKRIKNEDPMYHLIPQFLPHRYDAMNMITLDIPEAPMRRYMNEKRREGRRISHLALFLCAYCRTVERFPALNRFIVSRKIYQRNYFSVAMAVLRPNGEDTITKTRLEYTDDIFTVQEKLDSCISTNRQEEIKNSLDRVMGVMVKAGFLMRLAMGLLRLGDSLGLLPGSLLDMSPFHASILVSNLASIRTNHIYHHIYDFGSVSVSMTIGNLRERPRRLSDGSIDLERCVPLGVVMDERICNGHYCAQAFAYLQELLKDPRKLESPAESKTGEAVPALNEA